MVDTQTIRDCDGYGHQITFRKIDEDWYWFCRKDDMPEWCEPPDADIDGINVRTGPFDTRQEAGQDAIATFNPS